MFSVIRNQRDLSKTQILDLNIFLVVLPEKMCLFLEHLPNSRTKSSPSIKSESKLVHFLFHPPDQSKEQHSHVSTGFKTS